MFIVDLTSKKDAQIFSVVVCVFTENQNKSDLK